MLIVIELCEQTFLERTNVFGHKVVPDEAWYISGKALLTHTCN